MAEENTQFQLVTFQLGDELYGVDIMDVKEIVKVQPVRPIPNAPYYVEGIINLRSEIIPIMNLHKRFYITKLAKDSDGDLTDDDGGFIILDIEGNKIGIIIDRIARVVPVNSAEIKAPPQMLSGIGTEYIQGVVQQDNSYLIIMDIRKLFSAKELQKMLGDDSEDEEEK
ncbi:chemotaxis protein CheW [Treponema sp.]|uniref:chemotaxis protein CheW n=1 Tax=Treponema sp. TaxID=166 RepID=UPI0025F5DBD4|nr:chemotaxis protein CheW [Treponema sp.]MCR5219106.1 chemotaxis protein CheW [Treponema sp.]